MANKKFLNPINLVNLASDPGTASEGDIYYNTTSDAVKVYANGAWVPVGNDGGSDINVSTTAPSSPATGDAWYKNDTGEFYVYDGTYWVEVNGVIEGTNTFNTISVSGQSDVVADSSTDTLTLVAGTNVSITTNATNDSITINADSKSTSSVYLVRNNTGSTILKGTLVSASGAEPSGRIDVEPFAAVGGINSELTVMGMATANISNGVNGEVISFGTLTGIDTRGDTASAIAVGDETWAAGDILFAHPTVAGKLTNVRPQHDLAVAFITVRHASTGQIAVRIVPGNNHLEWMHDVTIDTPADNEVLAYDSSSGLWKNQTASEAGLSASDHNHTVDSLSNVVITGTPTDGQALVWDTTTSKWINETVSAVTDISSLTDVTISGTIADNEVLAYDTATSQWINQTTAEAGLLDTSATAQTKAGDLTITGNLTVNGTTTTINSTAVNVNNQVIFEGSTADGFETTLTSIDPTADRTISLPNESGTLLTTNSIGLDVQAFNSYLSSISGLTGDGFVKKSGDGFSTDSNTYALSSALLSYATINSPEFTGTPLAPTPMAGDNSTEIATTEFVATSFAKKDGPTFTGTVVLPATTSIGVVTGTEIDYLSGVTSDIQTQLNSKPTMTDGEISDSVIPDTIARVTDLSNSLDDYILLNTKAQPDGVASLDESGKVPSTQLDLTAYASLSGPTFTGTTVLPSTTSIGDVSSTEIGYLNGVTSSIQTQINDKLSSSTAESQYLTQAAATTSYQPKDADLTAIAALTGTSGFLTKSGSDTWTLDTNTYLTTTSATANYLTQSAASTTYAPKAEPTFTGTVTLPSTTSIGDVSATEISYLDGVTSSIQTQITSKASSSHTHSYQDADSDLTAIAAITSGVGLLKRLGPDTWTIDTNAYITGSSPTISTSLISGTSTFNLINSIATTVNFAGAATTLIIGATDAGATTTIRTPTILTTSSNLDLFNTTATTVNFAGAATTFTIGGTPTESVTATLFGNATTTTKTINIGTGGASGSETNINIGSSTSGATGTVSVYPSTNFVGTVTVPTPTSSGHATTKGYVDALAAGITVKAQVVYVSSANLNATYANGTSDSSGGLGVGATLTGNVDGALILDGPEVEAGQRVLIKNQTDAKHNGIYVVTFAGDGDDPFILTRATDFNGNTSTNGIIKNGAYIFVTSGTSSANDSYVVSLGGTSTTPSGAIKIGTDNIVLAQYSGVPNNISTLGYVTTGTWAATPIDKDFIDVEIARTNDPVFTGHVTVPSPTDDTDAANKEYVDDLIFASLPYLPDIIPLDDLRYEFNDMDSRFVPKFQGEQVAINNPLRLLLTINGIIQTVDFPEYVWQSMLPREGFMVDSDGYIAFSEVPPVGSTFDARLMLGPNVNSIKKGYPFKAVDILLGA
jgi:hypothetical protein